MSRERNVSIRLPQLTPESKKVAREIADACFALPSTGELHPYRLKEITHDQIRQESIRIASIEDQEDRRRQIHSLLGLCLKMVADCQGLAEAYLWVADELAELHAQLTVEGSSLFVPEVTPDPSDK